MARIKTVQMICDICGNEEVDEFGDSHVIEVELAVVVCITEQNEGNSVDPYLSIASLDLCSVCHGKIIAERILPTASGAQGHNTYTLSR